MAEQPSGKLHIGLWVVQGLLALTFGMAGLAKLGMPLEDLAAQGMTHATNLPWPTERIIGASEFLGAIGLVVPAATGIQPKLTGYAAIGLVIIMVLAMGYHVVFGEAPASVVNVVLGGMAAFVAWGRLVKAPILPKQN